MPYIFPQNEKLTRPTLWHWDIHSANLFVEGNRVASLIDWQDIWAGPLFLQFRHPKVVDYNGEVLLKLPENYESLEEGNEKARMRKQVERSIVLYNYETETEKRNPLLSEILRIHQGEKQYTLLRIRGMQIFYLFDSALFESRGSFTPVLVC